MEGVGFIGLGVELLTDEVNVDVVALDVEDDRAVEFGDVFHQVKRSAFGIGRSKSNVYTEGSW